MLRSSSSRSSWDERRANARPNAKDFVLRERVAQRVDRIIERVEKRRAPVKEDTNESSEARGENVSAKRAH